MLINSREAQGLGFCWGWRHMKFFHKMRKDFFQRGVVKAQMNSPRWHLDSSYVFLQAPHPADHARPPRWSGLGLCPRQSENEAFQQCIKWRQSQNGDRWTSPSSPDRTGPTSLCSYSGPNGCLYSADATWGPEAAASATLFASRCLSCPSYQPPFHQPPPPAVPFRRRGPVSELD